MSPTSRKNVELPFVKRLIEHCWYNASPLFWLLLPLSWLYAGLVWLRQLVYRYGVLKSYRSSLPVIIVGNITVGGTGKTPLVLWLAEFLCRQGFRPGIITRGYGGKATEWPQQVSIDSDATLVGDEAVLLAGRSGCPVMVGPERPRSVARLEEMGCDIILSDDGLQHYALARDLEIAVVDGQRRLGNGHYLPAGPLREGAGRLTSVDMVVVNGGAAATNEFSMSVVASDAVSMADPAHKLQLNEFAGGTVVAIAGIGNPERFFSTLRDAGLKLEDRSFPDHHPFVADDLKTNGKPLLMTEKDAVKCQAIAPDDSWYVPASAVLNDDFIDHLTLFVKDLKSKD